ncbi:MAG: hypothetical protein J3K34DRAFT_440218 [Monoraphidium minutum]|nr:MAG: hypothetical protein J3K34DRAFT_440218 [Monoraphidium minutum]
MYPCALALGIMCAPAHAWAAPRVPAPPGCRAAHAAGPMGRWADGPGPPCFVERPAPAPMQALLALCGADRPTSRRV